MSIAVGVDIGGSHITAGWVDLAAAGVIEGTLQRKGIDSNGSAESIINEWALLLQDLINDKLHDSIKVGIALPGPCDYEEGICLITEQDKFKHLYGVNLRRLIADGLSLPRENIRFVNDAESYLAGEMAAGDEDFSNVLGLTLGTGLGSALHNSGRTRDADLWKHPFKAGIAEDYLSTRWFVERYVALAGEKEKGLKEIVARGRTAVLQQLFLEFARNLCDLLVQLSRQYSFEAVVLGGNISQAHEWFLPALKGMLSEKGVKPNLFISRLQEEAALIGAACQWRENFQQQKERAVNSLTTLPITR